MIPQSVVLTDGFHTPRTPYREQWLTHVAVLLRAWFSQRGYEIPLRIRLGVGALSNARRTLGVCHAHLDRDGFRHITISPFIDDPMLVSATLVHELIHALLPADEIHGRRFTAAAQALGLEAPWTGVTPGVELAENLRRIVRQVGPYPHRALAA